MRSIQQKHLQLFTLALALVAASAAGCWWHSSTEPDERDSIVVTSASPPSGTRLAPGSAVTFTANVNYQLRSNSVLADDRGTLIMDIDDQNSRDLDTEVVKTVGHGQGSTSLADRLVVPSSGVSQVQVVVELTPDGFNSPTVTSVAATYPVRR